MNNKRIVFALMLFLHLFSIESLLYAATDDGDTHTLNDFYEQNGDCYLLIGNARDTSKSGVYQLNNLTNKSVVKLYNPGNAYGITAGLKIKSGALEKSLYTFISKDRDTRDGKGRITTRPMLTGWSYGTWQSDDSSTPNNVAPYIVHRYHTLPNDAASNSGNTNGAGNHTSGYGLYKFDNKCIPCSIDPVYAGKNEDGEKVYRYKIGEEWYHTVSHPAYSRYTYCTKGTWSRFSSTGFTDIWRNDDEATRNANDPDYHWDSTRYGGWVHYVAKEDVTEITEKLWLQAWIIGSGFDSSQEKKITDVVVGANSSMSLKGECIDGCISDVDNITLPGEPAPYLDTAYSAQTKASYVYTRNRGSDTGLIEGLKSDDTIVGNRDTGTTKFVGISSKSDTGNYVYLLGSDVINQWMRDLSCPSSMLISDPEDLVDIAVSDQWWQNGGIVYAYDKAKKKVYCFVRDENLNKSDPVKEISADLGGSRLPDKIGADGFGSLYFLKTDLSPETTNPKLYFASRPYSWSWCVYPMGYDRGKPIFRAYYQQKILKSVYKKPYGSDSDPERLAKDVTIDTNVYYRDWQTVDDTPWGVISNYISTVEPYYEVNDLSGDYRAELAVINCPTPPRPDHIKAVTDNNGPMIYNTTTHMYATATKGLNGYYPGDKVYYFMVENAPYFDANLVNIGNTDVDIDGDGKVGRFPNTIKKESVEYYWQIRRVIDREGKKVDERAEENQILDDGAGGHIVKGNYILPFPTLIDKGTYRVGVKVKYRYYDYAKLPVGALASAKESCLSALTVASVTLNLDRAEDLEVQAMMAGHSEDKEWSWESINFAPATFPTSPDGDGVIMTNTKIAGDYYMPGEGLKCSSKTCGHEQCENTKNRKDNPIQPMFILDGRSLCKSIEYKNDSAGSGNPYYPSDNMDWGIKLRDNTYNLKTNKLDRVKILTSAPPDPHDSGMIAGSLKWLDHKPGHPEQNNLKVQWSSTLTKNGTQIFQNSIITTGFELNLNEIRQLFPVPSEPVCYTLSVRADSIYTYSFMDYGPRMVAGGKYVNDYHEASMNIPISISATAKVCVTDNQGPGYLVYDADGSGKVLPGYVLRYSEIGSSVGEDFVRATSGERISDIKDGNKDLYFYVADNNPFANYEGVKECTGVDKYHYNGSGYRNRLVINHNIDNRRAYLYNEDCSHERVYTGAEYAEQKPIGECKLPNFKDCIVSRTDLTESEKIALSHSNLVVYTKYKFSANDLGKFSSASKMIDANSISFEYASNKSDYANLKFGIRWKESCYSSVNSLLELGEGNLGVKIGGGKLVFSPSIGKTEKYFIGEIVSIDNDRPNVYIHANHEKGHGEDFVIPRSINSRTKYGTWFPTVEGGFNTKYYIEQGPATWDLKGDPTSYFNNSFLSGNSKSNLIKELFEGDNILLADVPVTFSVTADDNSGGSIYYDYIKVCREGSTSPYAGIGSTDFPAKDNRTVQCVFRDRTATRYYVEASVYDYARPYPAKAKDAKTVSLTKTNNRKIKAYFTVYPSRLDYRILDRDITHEKIGL